MTGATFVPTDQSQDVPPGAILPPGCQIENNVCTGQQRARIAPNGNGHAHAFDAAFEEEYHGPEIIDHEDRADQEPDGIELFAPTMLEGVPVPPRKWVVRDWVPRGYVTALYGDGGMGKTLLAQMLSTAVATGNSWLGLETTGPLNVLALLFEDDREELHRRQYDINNLYNLRFAELGNIRWSDRLGKDNLMMMFDPSGAGKLTPFYHRTLKTRWP